MSANAIETLCRSLTTCPDHGMPDCSPLLNGCSRVIENDAALDAVEALIEAAAAIESWQQVTREQVGALIVAVRRVKACQ